MYFFMVALISAVCAASFSVPSSASGRMRLIVETAPSAFFLTRSQYAWSEVNWSQAMTAHFSIWSVFGSRMFAGKNAFIVFFHLSFS